MNNKHKEKRLFNVQELSKYLGLSPYTVRNKVRQGEFPFKARRLGRLMVFDIQDVDNYVESLPVIKS